MVHTYYYVMRVLGELLSISAVLLLVLQIRRDGVRNMVANFNQSHRVFRVSALASAVLLIIINVDFYGVLGIWPPKYFAIHYMIYSAILTAAITHSAYTALVAAFPFLFVRKSIGNERRKLATACSVYYVVCMSIYSVTTFSGNHRLVATFLRVSGVFPLFAVFAVVLTYYRLRQSFRLHAGASDPTKTQFNNIVRKWRNYSLWMGTLNTLLMAHFFTAANRQDADELAGVADLEVGDRFVTAVDKSDQMVWPFVFIFSHAFVYMLLWHSWKTQEHSRGRRLTSSTPARSSNQELQATSSTRTRGSTVTGTGASRRSSTPPEDGTHGKALDAPATESDSTPATAAGELVAAAVHSDFAPATSEVRLVVVAESDLATAAATESDLAPAESDLAPAAATDTPLEEVSVCIVDDKAVH